MAGDTYSFKGATAQWGTTSTHGSGTVVDENLKRTGQTDSVENNQGARTGVVIYDELYSGTLTIVAAANGQLPDIGSVVTVLGVQLLVTDTENKGAHKGKRMFTITCEGGKNLNLGSSGGGSSGGASSGGGTGGQ